MVALAESKTFFSTSSNSTNVVFASVTPGTGDVIVLKGIAEDSTGLFGTPTNTGSTITWTKRIEQTAVSHVYAVIWTGAVTAGGSATVVTMPWAGTGSGATLWHMGVLERYTSAKLATTPATNGTNGSGAPSGSITTAAASSIVSWLNGDWAAVAPGTPAYRSSATQDALHDRSPGSYVGYSATQAAASAGAQTYGLTSPTGQTYSLLAIEVQDASGGTNYTATPNDPVGITDAASTALSAARGPADPVGITDAATTSMAGSRTADDPVGITDSVTASIGMPRTTDDPVGITDSATTTLAAARTADDPVGITDAAAATLTMPRTTDDPVGITDAVASNLDMPRTAADPVGITDSVAATVDYARTAADPVGITDAASAMQGFARTAADTVAITDLVGQILAAQRTADDQVGITDSVSVVLTSAGAVSVNDPVGITDDVAIVILAARVIADVVGITDSVTAVLTSASGVVVNDPVGITDAVTVVLSTQRAAADMVGITDSVTAVITSGGIRFYLWNGSTEIPLNLEGVWDGASVVPATVTITP